MTWTMPQTFIQRNTSPCFQWRNKFTSATAPQKCWWFEIQMLSASGLIWPISIRIFISGTRHQGWPPSRFGISLTRSSWDILRETGTCATNLPNSIWSCSDHTLSALFHPERICLYYNWHGILIEAPRGDFGVLLERQLIILTDSQHLWYD